VSQVEKAFQMTPNGAFMERRGAGWNEERRFCQKKLCFVATDQPLLAEVLGQLVERPDAPRLIRSCWADRFWQESR